MLSSVQLLSRVWLFATPWTAAYQASLSITNSWSLPKLMSIESVMPSNHLILCRPLLLLPSIFPNIRIFSNKSALRIRWPKYWNFSFSISPFNVTHGVTNQTQLSDWSELKWYWGGRIITFTCAQLCPALVIPWTLAHQAPLSMGFFWHFLLQGIFQARDQTHISCIAGRCFTTEPLGKPRQSHYIVR